MGDADKVMLLFSSDLWKNATTEKWREDYLPLERYTPSQNEFNDWPIEISSYSDDQVADAKANGVVWLMVVTAEKI